MFKVNVYLDKKTITAFTDEIAIDISAPGTSGMIKYDDGAILNPILPDIKYLPVRKIMVNRESKLYAFNDDHLNLFFENFINQEAIIVKLHEQIIALQKKIQESINE